MEWADLINAGIPISAGDPLAMLKAESAIDWMLEHTTLDIDKGSLESITKLPACAKLFIVKFSETVSRKQGVTSQNIEGMSQSFSDGDQSSMILQLANTLLRPYLKSQVRVFPAKRRW